MKNYDEVADLYSEMWTDPASLEEDEELFNYVLAPKGFSPQGKILDIGCGQGLLLDHWDIDPDNYTGIDPSIKMLEYFKEKHPAHPVFRASMEAWVRTKSYTYDIILAVYGSASYIDPVCWKRLPGMLNPGGVAKLMFFHKDYSPVETHKHMKKPPSVYELKIKDLFVDLGMDVNAAFSYWRNYVIVHVIK